MQVFKKVFGVLAAVAFLTAIGFMFAYCLVTPDDAYGKDGVITKQQKEIRQKMLEGQEPQEVLIPRSMPLPLSDTQKAEGKKPSGLIHRSQYQTW